MELSIIIGILIISVTVITVFNQYNKSQERRSMLEKGLDPSLVNIYPKRNRNLLFLYTGIILLGFALGIITGILMAGLLRTPGETKELIGLSVIIFTGFSCFTCYYISRKASE